MSGSAEETFVSQSEGAASPPAEALQRGAAVGRYLVLSRLGAGGMGVVYAGYDPELDRKVALKLLRTSPTDSNESTLGRQRLLREAPSSRSARISLASSCSTWGRPPRGARCSSAR